MDLPSGYTQLEYIESTGTQYIDTGYKPNSNTRVVMDADLLDFSSNTYGNSFFGVRSSNNTNAFLLICGITASATWTVLYGSSSGSATMTALGRHYIDFDKNVCKIDGTSVSINSGAFVSDYPCLLFTDNKYGTANTVNNSRLKLYSCKIYDNGTIIRDYIPCATADGQVGLYDAVNGVFYGNAGTGNFLRGKVVNPVLPDGFVQIEYIESSGTQYIDTGFKPDSNTKIVAEMAYVRFDNNTCGLVGSSGSAGIEFYYYSSTSSQRYIYMFNSTDNNSANAPLALGTKLYIDLAKTNATVTVDGTVYTMTPSSSTNFTASYTLHIHTLWRNGAALLPSSSRTYSFMVYDNGTLVREYIPCVSNSGEVGLYDIIGKQFYGNSGSGSFLRGKMLNPKLPSGFVRTEYIESTGTQYIDTGFVPNQDTRVFCEAVFAPATSAKFLFGARTSTTSNQFMLACTSSGEYTSGYGGASKPFPAAHSTTDIIFVDKDKETTTITHTDGTTASVVGTESTFTAPNNMVLFGCNTKGTVRSSKARIYSCQIYDNGVLVREFVPCKNSGDVGGLYDVLNGVFYGNAGSGEFLLGAEIDVEPDPEPIPPEEFPLMVYDRTYTDLLRAKELATIGYASMTDAEREEWNGGLRGAYNAIDFNRVENAVFFLCVVLKDLPQEIRDFAAELKVSWDSFFDIPYSADNLNLTIKNTWKVGEIPTKAEKSRYLSNVAELRRTLDYETDMLPASMDGLTINGANAIEKALAFLHTEIDKFRQMRKTQIENTAAAWFYADEIYADEV